MSDQPPRAGQPRVQSPPAIAPRTTSGSEQVQGPRRYLTVANSLTLLRLLLIVPSVLAITAGHWKLAAALFAVAAVSDYYDGRLARQYAQASVFGGLFDHGTDALYVTGCLAAAALNGQLTPVLPILVPLAFTQYLLDSRTLAGQPLRGNRLGRFNGVAYFFLAGACIGQPLLHQLGLPVPAAVVSLTALGLCATTLLSMLIRALYWWRLSRSKPR